jgi:hypothetical protein
MSGWRNEAARVCTVAMLALTGCAGAPREQAALATTAVTQPGAPAREAASPPPAIVSAPRPAKTPVSPSPTPMQVPSAPPMPAELTPAALRGEPAPVWRVGDQWAFRWESSQGQGEYVWTVDRIESLDGVPHYVIKTGPREIFYRARDLATRLETLSGEVEVRHEPARLSFSWPLRSGTMWRQSLDESRGPAERKLERTIAWKVESEEQIRVEAGIFDTLKIVARHENYDSPAVMYEMWYAPKAKQWVRLQEHFPSGVRYRELIDFALN